MTTAALWTKHRPVALAIARDYRVPGMDPDDVRQEALVALWEAARCYDKTRGPFPAFARTVIRRRCVDLLRTAQTGKHRVLTDAGRDEQLELVPGPDVTVAVLARGSGCGRRSRVRRPRRSGGAGRGASRNDGREQPRDRALPLLPDRVARADAPHAPQRGGAEDPPTQPRGEEDIRALMTTTIIALTITTPVLGHHNQGVLERIGQARHQARQCQTQLGLQPSSTSSKPITGHRYARWVLALWQARADAYCGLIRSLQGRGARALRDVVDPCLARIIDMENVVWDPTVGYGFRHGNVHEAYGLPQARPGTKMASAGEDWQTNPITQLRWMQGYVDARYGGACAALSHRVNAGWY